eukprot:TRINITY_DN1202_c0_g1_i2.p2 TRINITY_DN1202_c0_g1~~TRINITY_DN1202_c0_g1_i2.p2  ORF type:complete len:266 (+),score=36.91 TRINITY_DN1202_c0_g1_i2:530-1327(+)
MAFDGSHELAGSKEIIDHFKRKGYNMDSRLSKEQEAESRAYTALVEDKLSAVLEYHLWRDSENFYKSTRHVFVKGSFFPLSVYQTWKLRNEHLRPLNPLTFSSDDAAYDIAAECYEALDTRIGQQLYFFGNSPASLDAVVFGHLGIHLYAEFPNNRLRKLLQEYPNLVRFCNSIRERYYRDITPALPSTETPETDRLESSRQARRESLAHDGAAGAGPGGSSDEDGSASKERSAQDKRMRRRARYWAAFSGAFLLIGLFAVPRRG